MKNSNGSNKSKRNRKLVLLGLVLIALIVVFILPGELPEKIIHQETKILFVGDMMFDRTIRRQIYANGVSHPFSCAKDVLNQYDFVVGNLEGPVTENVSVSITTQVGDTNNMRFTFPTNVAEALFKHNIKAVTLANNHILDFGRSGLEETRKFLTESKVDWFGDPYLKEKKSFVTEIKGNKVALIGFNQFLGVDSVKKTAEEIKKLKIENSKLKIIVFAHWGEEYVPANDFQKNAAHAFIDAGADLVIGSHPHVIQESENYKGKMIYYSLGNFIFDQWWEAAVRQSLGVELSIKGNNLETKTINFESSRDGRTCLIE